MHQWHQMQSRLFVQEFAVVLFLAAGVFKAGAVAAPNALAPMPNEKTAAHEALERYLHNSATGGRDGGGQVTFEIDASLPKLKKHGIMRGLRVITVAGRVAFTQIHFVGDELVKSAVINRFLTAEARERRDEDDVGVSARNYRLRYKGRVSYNDRTVFVFRTEPRKRRVGLFTGELWLDSETARPLREWGEFIKSPSVFLSNISFVRDYVSDSRGSYPLRIILKMRAAFAGPVELTMWLSQVPGASKNGLAGEPGPALLKASPAAGM
jgi:hypothetical protein